MEVPEVRFVITDDDVRIAYQDFGDGPPTVFVPTVLGHLEGTWAEEYLLRRFYERLGANLRVLTFDHRGNGMSDGFSDPPSLSERMLDIKAVMDAGGTDQANLLGFSFGAQLAVGFAVQHSERVDRLVLVNSRVGRTGKLRADELHTVGEEPPPSGSAGWDLNIMGVEVDDGYTYFSPSLAKYPDVLRSLPKFERMAGTRDVYKRQLESIADVDVVGIAPLVRAPTLITHMAGNRVNHVGYARLLAELIPDSTLLELEGSDHLFWFADNWRDIADAHIGFITESDVDAPAERRFAVVLFTDIVESTSASLAAGDNEWRRRLDAHDRISRQVVTRHHGSIIKNTGDGILATFDTPSRAVDAAIQIRHELAESGISVRGGIHAGEVEVRGDDISGAVVNLAARVEQAATDGAIYTSKTIRDMLIGSQHQFEYAGSHNLKGFDEDWALYQLAIASPHP